MTHDARTLDVGQHDPFGRPHPPSRRALAATGGGSAGTPPAGRVLEGGCSGVERRIDEGDDYPWKVYVNQFTGERTTPAPS